MYQPETATPTPVNLFLNANQPKATTAVPTSSTQSFSNTFSYSYPLSSNSTTTPASPSKEHSPISSPSTPQRGVFSPIGSPPQSISMTNSLPTSLYSPPTTSFSPPSAPPFAQQYMPSFPPTSQFNQFSMPTYNQPFEQTSSMQFQMPSPYSPNSPFASNASSVQTSSISPPPQTTRPTRSASQSFADFRPLMTSSTGSQQPSTPYPNITSTLPPTPLSPYQASFQTIQADAGFYTQRRLEKTLDEQQNEIVELKKQIADLKSQKDAAQKHAEELSGIYKKELEQYKKILEKQYQHSAIAQLVKENAELRSASIKETLNYQLVNDLQDVSISRPLSPLPRTTTTTTTTRSRSPPPRTKSGLVECCYCFEMVDSDDVAFNQHLNVCLTNIDNTKIKRETEPTFEQKTTILPQRQPDHINILYSLAGAKPKIITVPKLATVGELKALIEVKEGKLLKGIVRGSPLKDKDQKLESIKFKPESDVFDCKL